MLCQTLAPAKHTKVDWRSVGEQMRRQGYVLPADESYGLTPYDVDLSYTSPRFWTQGQFGLLRSSLAFIHSRASRGLPVHALPPVQNHRRAPHTGRADPPPQSRQQLMSISSWTRKGSISMESSAQMSMGDRILQLSQQVWVCDRDNLATAMPQPPHRFAARSRSKETVGAFVPLPCTVTRAGRRVSRRIDAAVVEIGAVGEEQQRESIKGGRQTH